MKIEILSFTRSFPGRLLECLASRLVPLVLLLSGCAAPLTQTPPAGMAPAAAAAAPAIGVGDTWIYRVRDGYTGLERGNQRHQVLDAGAQRVEVAVSGDSGAGEEIHVYDGEWNWLRRPATNLPLFDYSPPYRAYVFPLAAGKTWRSRLIATDPATGRRFPVWIDGTVVGWEKVQVPAGAFDTLKIKRVVFLGYWESGVRDRSEIIEYEWYSPAVRQAVKREASSRYLSYLAGRTSGFVYARDGGDGDGPRMVRDDWLIYELADYSLR